MDDYKARMTKALAVQCPQCHAGAGKPCVWYRMWVDAPHERRVRLSERLPKCDWVTDADAHEKCETSGLCDAPAARHMVSPRGRRMWVCSLHIEQGCREGGRTCDCRNQAEPPRQRRNRMIEDSRNANEKPSVNEVAKDELGEIAGLVRELYWRSNHGQHPDAWTDDCALQVEAVFERHGINLGLTIAPCECDDPMQCYLATAHKPPKKDARKIHMAEGGSATEQ